MTDKTGGPAFPNLAATDIDGYVFAPAAEGMTKLDFFACAALVGRWIPDYAVQPHEVAETAYDFAAAMLAERERRMRDE